MNVNGLNAYKQTRVKTAGQGRLIVMLYDEAIKQLDYACKELDNPRKKLDSVHNAIVKTQDIVTELMVSLDFEKGGEIAKNLFSLYMFFNQQLVNANMKKDKEMLLDVRNFLNDLRSAWVSIENKSAGSEPKGKVGVNIAG